MRISAWLPTLFLVLALSVDSFAASFGLGSKGQPVRITIWPAIVISGIGSLTLTCSFLIGMLATELFSLPELAGRLISAGVLIGIGVVSLFSSFLKNALKRARGQRKLCFKLVGIDWVISLYLDESLADVDNSKTLSTVEAAFLAIGLSADSLVNGFLAQVGGVGGISVIVSTFLCGLGAVLCGNRLGIYLNSRVKGVDLGWLSGIFIIILGVLKVIF